MGVLDMMDYLWVAGVFFAVVLAVVLIVLVVDAGVTQQDSITNFCGSQGLVYHDREFQQGTARELYGHHYLIRCYDPKKEELQYFRGSYNEKLDRVVVIKVGRVIE